MKDQIVSLTDITITTLAEKVREQNDVISVLLADVEEDQQKIIGMSERVKYAEKRLVEALAELNESTRRLNDWACFQTEGIKRADAFLRGEGKNFYPMGKIQAIKEVRFLTNLGLKDTKDMVENVWAEFETQGKEAFGMQTPDKVITWQDNDCAPSPETKKEGSA